MRLQYRVTLSMFAVLLVVGVMGGAAVLYLQRRAAIAQFERSAFTLVSSIEESLRHDMLEVEREHIQAAVDNIAESDMINEVVILSVEQKIFASVDKQEVGGFRNDEQIAFALASGEVVSRTEETYGRTEFCVILPVTNGPECHGCHGSDDAILGAIEIGLDRQPLEDQLREQTLLLLLIGGLTFVGVGLALSVVMRSAVLTPLARLGASARRIAGGDFSARTTPRRSDEVGALADTFNDMAGRIEQHAAALEDAKADLEARVQERTEQVQQLAAARGRLLGRLISAQEEERRRIARELHDETGQSIAAIMLDVARVRDGLPPDETDARTRLSEAGLRASDTMHGLRKLINDLRPEVLDQLGLVPALRSHVKNRLEAEGVEAHIQVTGLAKRVSPQVETTIFRVVQEAVANIRHSGATSVDIQITAADATVTTVVSDDGTGFDVEAALRAADSWGLRGMSERVSIVGGNLSVESEVGKGTRIEFEIPLGGV